MVFWLLEILTVLAALAVVFAIVFVSRRLL